MGEVRGIDYAWARPDPAEIARRGYTFVCRYYSRDLSKSLSADEARALDSAGLSIVTVFEDQANRATQGRDAGVQDGQWSAQLAAAAGQPPGTPIFVAVDYDALESDWAAIAIYLDGFREGSNHPVGIYGKDTLVERMMTDGHAVYGWQTVAWSEGRLDQQAHLYQRAEQDFGGDADINVALQPYFGGWRLTGTQPPPPVPAAAPPDPSPFPFGVEMDSETFVRWAYASFLFRDPDQQGLNTFVAYDQQHGHAACLTAILDSAEGQKRLAQMRHLLDSQPLP